MLLKTKAEVNLVCSIYDTLVTVMLTIASVNTWLLGLRDFVQSHIFTMKRKFDAGSLDHQI